MSELLKRLETLSLEKRQLILQKLQEQQQISANKNQFKTPPIESVSRNGLLPLSFSQTRLWFLDQLEAGSANYNMTAAVQLTGVLQVAALIKTINHIVQRHEVLRTNFKTVNNNPVQVITPSLQVNIPVVDLQVLSPEKQLKKIKYLATAEQERPFDLTKDSLLRVTLLQLGEESHVMLVNMHHIVSDGWSMEIFIQEVSSLYTAFSQDKPPLLPKLDIQYADFAHWQRKWLQGEVLDNQLEYWRQQLADAPSILELPTDRPRPPIQTFRGSTEYFEINQHLTQQLNHLSRKSGTTLFMTLMAAFVTLLYRYSKQSDIVIGSPIANRDRWETNQLIGLFVNTLVLRTKLEGNPNFEELLQRVRQVVLDAYNHKDVPLEQLVEVLQPERSLSHMPLLQVMFALQNNPKQKLELSGLTLTPLKVDNSTAKFDLTLSMEETESGLVGEWEYNSDLFDGTTITRMAGHFQTLLANVVTNPHQRILEVPILSNAERHQLLVEWNNTQTEYPQDQCIHELFAQQVERHPDAVALVYEGQQLTYQELNCRANQLAHYLQTLGVKPEVMVGICVERSLEMVVGVMAVLKAGGAYLPLDPAYPQDRLAYMLSDSQVPILLTQGHLVENLPENEAVTICLDELPGDVLAQSPENPVQKVHTTDLAYVIYTSGSTGKPKGVMVTHAGGSNLSTAQIQTFDIHSESRILQFASFSFDASVSEIIMALGSGARLYLATKESLLPGLPLIQLLSHHGITHITLPPSALAVLPLAELPALQTIIVAGEACSPDLIEQWSDKRRFFNAYGPTEATVCSTTAECSDGSSKPPIGRPIANTQIYLLDSQLQPVPIGVPGELHIGGVGLARGYLNRPQLSAEKFIPNPFSNEPGSRLYKTGDLARYLVDGNIEYLGRIDNQVKIRGFRIELGEIEALLSQHPGVMQTTVIVREDIPGNKRLVAYFVAHPDQVPSISELRQFLKQQLTDYMMPSAFVMLPALPLTPNGKVDRRALPAPEPKRQVDFTLVAPRTPIEEKLVEIWADVLRLEQVNIHDNFFEIGGDSILSLQIIARANQAGIQLSPKHLFGQQTIAELAAVAGTTTSIKAEQSLVTGTLPLTPIQSWFFEQNLPELSHFNQSLLLEVPPDLQPQLLEQVLQQLLVHHDALRLQFNQEQGSWQQINAGVDKTVPLQVVDLSGMSSEKQQLTLEVIAQELQASLDLAAGPLMGAALFNLGLNQPPRLFLTIHHLAVDGVSWRILLEDLFNTYQQISNGQAIQLPPKTSAFKDWAYRLTEYAQSPALNTGLGFWLTQGNKSFTSLPVDYPYSQEANTVDSMAGVSVSLSVEQTRVLLQEVPAVYNTQINDVLLTALVKTLTQWTGNSSQVVDLEGHGREELFEDIDLSRTIGWFTTLFPVRLELEATDYMGKALKSIKEQLCHFQKRGIGYGILRYLSQNPTVVQQLQALPVAEVSFNYLGQFEQQSSESALWRIVSESTGTDQSPLGHRNYLLEVNASISSGQLELNWIYSQNIHQRATIEGLALGFITALTDIINHCQSPDAGGYTPSDFPQSQLSQAQLDNLIAEMAVVDPQNHKKNIESIYPLSPMQQGMLFHTLYAPESRVYCEQLSCTLHGNLNISAFEQAWQQLIERHSVLRTCFAWEKYSQPLQVVRKKVDFVLATDDWRFLSPEEQKNRLHSFLEAERDRGFALKKPPLMRCTLIRLADETYQFVWCFHHLLIDGWSSPTIIQEAFAFYDALSKGDNLSLKTPRPYRDYITWLQQQDLSQAEQFWQQTLKGFTTPTPLISDKSIDKNSQQQYQEQHLKLSPELTTSLQSLVREYQLTLNTVIQGMWALLLSHYSGKKDIVFGATLSGRPPTLKGVESMVGMFINTLPVRVQISAEVELLSWLKNLQGKQVEREQYSYSPLVEIQRWSEVPRGTPLFESNVGFYNYPVDPSLQQWDGSLKVDNISNFERTKYPLMLVAMPGSELSLGLSYEGNRFAASTISKILEDFVILLRNIVEKPNTNLETLKNILAAAEREKQSFKIQELEEVTIGKLKKIQRKS